MKKGDNCITVWLDKTVILICEAAFIAGVIMESFYLKTIKRIHAIAESGIAFNKNDYEFERYTDIVKLCHEMIAQLANTSVEEIEGLMTGIVQPGDGNYVNPKIDVRGAVFSKGKVLLVQEKVDGLWSMPGGYADVGLSAAENTAKEVFEEAGIEVNVTKLYAVRHKSKNQYRHDIRDFYKFFFICEALPNQQIKAGMETANVGFFDLGALPPLSEGRVIELDIHQAWEHVCEPDKATIFD